MDVEGQGVRGDVYNTKLAVPVLLISKALIFNWRGPPAANAILQALGVLNEVAKRIRPDDKTKLGQLHIVLRDLHPSKAAECQRLVMDEEPGTSREVVERNDIRNRLRSTMASMTFWALPLPIRDAEALATQALRVDQASPEFQLGVRCLREAISRQLATTDGYTGAVLSELLPVLVQSANSRSVTSRSGTPHGKPLLTIFGIRSVLSNFPTVM